ncbi:MAG: hypothetical protein EA390_14785, partial [Balneolaceae bacterium]
YTVGVLVQSNFGGILTVNGAPVGQELGNHYMAAIQTDPSDFSGHKNQFSSNSGSFSNENPTDLFADTHDGYNYDVDGSIMIVVATDAPVTARNLERLAKRAFMSIARVGGFASNGSGDYVIAFSTHPDVRINLDEAGPTLSNIELKNAEMTPLFLAVVEATEEAILNSLFMAETMEGTEGRKMEALPIDEVMEILKKYRAAD